MHLRRTFMPSRDGPDDNERPKRARYLGSPDDTADATKATTAAGRAGQAASTTYPYRRARESALRRCWSRPLSPASYTKGQAKQGKRQPQQRPSPLPESAIA